MSKQANHESGVDRTLLRRSFTSSNDPFFARVTMVADAIATDGDVGTVWVSFLGLHFTDDSCVCDVRSPFPRDVFLVNGSEGIYSFDVWFS